MRGGSLGEVVARKDLAVYDKIILFRKADLSTLMLSMLCHVIYVQGEIKVLLLFFSN